MELKLEFFRFAVLITALLVSTNVGTSAAARTSPKEINIMKLTKLLILVALCMVTFAVAGVAIAQSGDGFEITSYTIDDGGRYSTGDGFWLGGTIGQPDAGIHTGGDFELSGGFWKDKEQYPTAISLLTLTAASNNKVLWFTLAASVLLVLNMVAWRWHRR